MYCTKCGLKLSDSTRFCTGCGTRFSPEGTPILPTTNSSQSVSPKIYTMTSLFIAGFLAILMFGKWFTIPIFSTFNSALDIVLDSSMDLPSRFSVLDIFFHSLDFINCLSDTSSKFFAVLLIGFNVILWCISLYYLIKYIFSILNKRGVLYYFSTGLVFLVILLLVDFIFMLLANANLSEGLGEYMDIKFITFNSSATIVFYLSLASRFFLIKKIKEEY